MRDGEIDGVLEKAARVPHPIEPALLRRIADSLGSSLQPVRPLPPTWRLAGGLFLIIATVGVAGAARAGFYGIEKMALLQAMLIFATLCVLAWAMAEKFVNELIPGSCHRVTPTALLALSSAALLGLFALLFRDYRTEHFFAAGIVCLLTGIVHAIPAGLLGWLLLRRGFAVNVVSAGLAGGALAGLAGIAVLELHCANFEALHILFWHTAVVPVSAALGAAVGWTLRKRSSRAAAQR